MTSVTLPADRPRSSSEEVPRKAILPNGRAVEIRVENGSVTLSPDVPLAELRGFLGNMKTDDLREKHERCITSRSRSDDGHP